MLRYTQNDGKAIEYMFYTIIWGAPGAESALKDLEELPEVRGPLLLSEKPMTGPNRRPKCCKDDKSQA